MFHQVVDLFALLAFWSPGPGEMLLLAIVALLLYGGQLPEVARSWGKSFAEFRRGLSGIQHDINEAIYSEPQRLEYRPERTSYADDSLPNPDEASTLAEDSSDEQAANKDPAAERD